MSKMPWFRMYADFLNDPKMISLAFEDQRHFIGVLALKCDGALDDVADGDLMDRIVAQRLWIDHAIIRDVKRRLIAAGLIDARWHPIAWGKRQMRSDIDSTAAARQKRFRESKRRNALHNASVTRLDTDTDTEEEAEIEPTATVSKAVGGDSAAPSAPPAPPADGDTEDENPKKAKTATRLPEGWVLPKAWGEWALCERADFTEADVRREAACFADHWHAKGGADARKVDWQATWRNWVRRAHGAPSCGTAARGGPGINPHAPVETYAQRAARQRMEEIAPAAARKAPGAAGSFEAAQRFMAGGDVIDVDAKAAAPRIGTQGGQ